MWQCKQQVVASKELYSYCSADVTTAQHDLWWAALLGSIVGFLGFWTSYVTYTFEMWGTKTTFLFNLCVLLNGNVWFLFFFVWSSEVRFDKCLACLFVFFPEQWVTRSSSESSWVSRHQMVVCRLKVCHHLYSCQEYVCRPLTSNLRLDLTHWLAKHNICKHEDVSRGYWYAVCDPKHTHACFTCQ